MGLFVVLHHSSTALVFPSVWVLAAAAAGTVIVTAVLAMVPARIGARRSVAPILQADS